MKVGDWSEGEPLASTGWWRRSQFFGEGGSLIQSGPDSIVFLHMGESKVCTGSKASTANVTLVPEGDIHITAQNIT